MAHLSSIRAPSEPSLLAKIASRCSPAARTRPRHIWDTQSGAPRGPHLQHEGTVVAATFAPDGKTILTGSADNTSRLWSTSNGTPVSYPLRHAGTVVSVAYSADGQTLLTGSVDHAARLWQMRGPSPIRIPGYGHRGAAFSPDGATVVTAGGLGVSFVEVQTGEHVELQEATNEEVVAFSPDGSTFLTAARQATSAELWNARTKAGWRRYSSTAGQSLRHLLDCAVRPSYGGRQSSAAVGRKKRRPSKTGVPSRDVDSGCRDQCGWKNSSDRWRGRDRATVGRGFRQAGRTTA